MKSNDAVVQSKSLDKLKMSRGLESRSQARTHYVQAVVVIEHFRELILAQYELQDVWVIPTIDLLVVTEKHLSRDIR